MANTFIFDDDEQPDMGGSEPGQDDQPDESESGNRSPFTIVAIGIGVVILLALICMVIVALVYIIPQRNTQQAAASTSAAATAAQNALVAQQTQVAAQATPTLSPTPILTDTPSNTPVVVFATDTPEGTGQDPATATVEALQTQLANAQLTVTFAPSATGGTRTKTRTVTATPQIPQTGFADEFGLPGLFIVALILLGVILLARRLRAVPNA
jgi:hypothetical protein